jgi:hypothetical protein
MSTSFECKQQLKSFISVETDENDNQVDPKETLFEMISYPDKFKAAFRLDDLEWWNISVFRFAQSSSFLVHHAFLGTCNLCQGTISRKISDTISK